jgi:hydroxymethylglutaryl-CoA lyase
VLAAAARLPALIGHDVPSQLLKAGRRSDLHRPPAEAIAAPRVVLDGART